MSLRNACRPKIRLLPNGPACPAARDSCSLRTRDERADLAAYRRARRRARTRRLGTGALGLAVLAGIWQLAAMLLHDPVSCRRCRRRRPVSSTTSTGPTRRRAGPCGSTR